MLSDCKALLAPAALTKIMALANSAVRQFLHDTLRSQGLTMRSSTHVKAGALVAQDTYAYACKGNGKDGAAVAAIWPSMQLIRDPYTNAAEGQVSLTAIQLWDFALVRTANFVRLEARTLA